MHPTKVPIHYRPEQESPIAQYENIVEDLTSQLTAEQAANLAWALVLVPEDKFQKALVMLCDADGSLLQSWSSEK